MKTTKFGLFLLLTVVSGESPGTALRRGQKEQEFDDAQTTWCAALSAISYLILCISLGTSSVTVSR